MNKEITTEHHVVLLTENGHVVTTFLDSISAFNAYMDYINDGKKAMITNNWSVAHGK